MRTNVSKAGMLLVALVIGSLVALPVVAQSKASEKNVESLNAVLKEITKGKTQVQGAMDALNALVSGGEANLTKNYNAFTKQVSGLTKTRTSVQARAEAIKQVMDSLQPAGDALREAFPPFFSDLNDVQKMLSVDLSQSGMTAAKPIGEKVVANGNIIVKSLDTYITTLTQVRDQIAPKAKKS